MSANYRGDQEFGGGDGAGAHAYGSDDLPSGAFNPRERIKPMRTPVPVNHDPTHSAQEGMMSLNFDELERKLDLETLQRVGAWSRIKDVLDRPDLFGVDFSPSSFDMEGREHFVGLVDLLLTYADPITKRDDQSVTVPATVRGRVDEGGRVVVDALDLAL